MHLDSGYRVCVAPRFHVAGSWPDRLRLNGGLIGAGDRLMPEPNWRPATDAELGLLMEPGPPDFGKCLCLLTIPEQLRLQWWEMAVSSSEVPDLEPFAAAVSEFLHFKQLPLPTRCAFEVRLTPPGPGEAWSDTVPTKQETMAAINLADERGCVVFLNLSSERTREIRSASDWLSYPLARILLDPGEGIWLPEHGMAFTLHATQTKEAGVWLVIRRVD